jgi:hypothetical protein
MGDVNVIQPPSASLKKAICWLSEMVQHHPGKKRKDILREAQIRFDLTPKECVFLEENFQMKNQPS